jgi:glycerol 3-phosphatase-2
VTSPARSAVSRQDRPGEPDEPGDRRPLLERYDAVVFDLDGVLHRGDEPIASAPDVLAEARVRGVPVAFLTNNSARTPAQVAARMSGLGLPATADRVVTSALATAAMLERDGGAGTTAFVIGERGIRDALSAIGVRVVGGEPGAADLVVVGWDRSVDYAALRTASLLVQRGARLVATNADGSFPAADGLWPGAGAILAAITTTTGAIPTIVGKPGAPMFDAAAALTGARRPLMVGDRIDTDIVGAARVGWDSLLVLSGATRAYDLPTAPALPTYLAADVGALVEPRTPARPRAATAEDAGAIAALLTAAGLPADGVIDRLGETVVLPGDAATAEQERRSADAVIPAATATIVPLVDATYVRSVAVRADVRGQGLGLLATAAALRLAGAASPAYLVTEDSDAFFARLGFVPCAADDVPTAVAAIVAEQGCGSRGTFMRREPSSRPAGHAEPARPVG